LVVRISFEWIVASNIRAHAGTVPAAYLVLLVATFLRRCF
jgi:hypothetical protein